MTPHPTEVSRQGKVTGPRKPHRADQSDPTDLRSPRCPRNPACAQAAAIVTSAVFR